MRWRTNSAEKNRSHCKVALAHVEWAFHSVSTYNNNFLLFLFCHRIWWCWIADICITKVRATSRSLETLTYHFFCFTAFYPCSRLPSLVFMLLLGVRFPNQLNILSLFPMFSRSLPDLLVSFPKCQWQWVSLWLQPSRDFNFPC